MRTHFDRHRLTFIFALCAALAGAATLPFVVSCRTQTRDDPAAFERLRALTRGGATPSEATAAQLASEHAGTRAGALALVLQARLRAAANNFAGAASVLSSRDIKSQTVIGDYALWLRADALEKAGRRAEARAALEELARDYPDSLRAREAALRAARMLAQDGQASGVPLAVERLADTDDGEALLLTAKAYEQTGDPARARAVYRRLYFYAPASASASEAEKVLWASGSGVAPGTVIEDFTRANKLYEAKRYAEAVGAYGVAFGKSPGTVEARDRLRHGVAAFHARRAPETIASLNAVPAVAGETRAEALHYLAQHYARARQWDVARSTLSEMLRAFPKSDWTKRAVAAAGAAARDAKNTFEASNFYRLAVESFPGEPEVAGAQFELAWAAHDAKRFDESSRLLVEHLASYADRNTDNRGRAGYWAARDSERAGRLAEARAIYEAMLERYDANWYGYLSKQRLDALKQAGVRVPQTDFAPGSTIARAVANLKPVVEAEETAGPREAARLKRAEELAAVGMEAEAHAELDRALEAAPQSPRLNLAKAKLHRARNDNVQAFNVLRRSFPDYSQMEVEELTPDEWDVFYPLAYWDIIVQESRAKGLDPYTVAGLIRQESVFNPRAASHADAYGLMQLLVPTARMTAKRYGVGSDVNVEALFQPRLNIQLGTSYLKDQLDKFGRIEYVAAAYNAGPGRAAAWRTSLPLQMDEWAEAIPFRETRGYVQGVVRNLLQYRRLYDEQGRFRPEVGSRAVRRPLEAAAPAATPAANARPRRVSSNEEE